MGKIFLTAVLLATALVIAMPGVVAGHGSVNTLSAIPPGPETSLVNVVNESREMVDLFVDGDFKATIAPQEMAAVPVAEGYRMFFIDRKGGSHTWERVYVPSGLTTFTIR